MALIQTVGARRALFAATALVLAGAPTISLGQTTATAAVPIATAPPQDAPAAGGPSSAVSEVVVTVAKTTRSSVAISAVEMQKLLPGVNPLKAIETLPGVVFETADPWGNNEQNEVLFVHGFSTQQLGYTMDGVPLGDQQYGNYNGLSVSRAVTSENVSRVELSSGAGALGVASTSNLGGAIETFSRYPSATSGADARETVGSYETTRTFLRIDTGESQYGNSAYVSFVHQDARAWDFDGHQRGNQANLKFVHKDDRGKLTLYVDWQHKVEPNEDAISYGNQQTAAAASFTPYTRPFIYPNIPGCISYLTGPGTPPAKYGNNFSNCFSAAQRNDVLGYIKYDYKLTSNLTWSNQIYEHYDFSRGIVAGPVNQAGLPTLFNNYFPGLVSGSTTSTASLTALSKLFGGTGYEVRTTEYKIDREGAISTLDWQLGDHQIELGGWYEHNEPTQHRVWYPFSSANDDLSLYDVPHGPSVFTQYAFQFFVNDYQLHLQDQWRILPNLLLQAGFKSSLQNATDVVLVQQENLALASGGTPVLYPTGTIDTDKWFLPQFGGVWDLTPHEQIFANAQENLRQFIPYGAGSNFFGFSPWSLGTQAAFNLFKSTVKPETSWTYELGVRSKRTVSLGFITGVEGQANVYHVDFSNRLLNVAPYNFINPAPAILVNVGGVTTNGADIAATLHFGPHFQIYDGLSYNKSTYNDNYDSGTTNGQPTVVATGGKQVPLEPDWLDKVIASANFGPFEAQLNGDYIGKRYVTYLNDLSVNSTFVLGLEASYRFQVAQLSWLHNPKISANVTNLTNTKGVSTAVVTSASGGYQAYPLPPIMGFLTLQAGF
jgi:outer membrane receptor protein involved in Fe transport